MSYPRRYIRSRLKRPGFFEQREEVLARLVEAVSLGFDVGDAVVGVADAIGRITARVYEL